MKEISSVFIPDENARRSLAAKLGMEYNVGMQDWEYEVSDSNRVAEYILEYDRSETTVKEKQSLMEIILDSMNDLLEMGRTQDFERYFNNVKKSLMMNDKIHAGTLHYWTNNDFRISDKLLEK